ncbi:PRC-barrel domain-containing protein [Kitasatospora sp. NPDC057015]|uniref:PRC-barrel domain-containing protein n=1 Tax=Kitasatospora sp. NPDC057015 TaxID=3346001 RepID=UPI0036410BC1
MSGIEIWEFRSTSGHVSNTELVGFRVEATDGHVGEVDRLSEEAGPRYLMVDTGPWIFGKHVLFPVVQIGQDGKTVHVDRTKDEIKSGPEYDPEKDDVADGVYKDAYAGYYGPYYGGPVSTRPPDAGRHRHGGGPHPSRITSGDRSAGAGASRSWSVRSARSARGRQSDGPVTSWVPRTASRSRRSALSVPTAG